MGILRFLLAISVVAAHSSSIFGFNFVGGRVAVQAFYIISGFYMTLILKEKYIGINGSYRLFITNRLLRLYPVYWVVLILSLLVSAVFFYFKVDNQNSIQYYFNYYSIMDIKSLLFLMFSNIFLLFQDIIMFLGLDLNSGNLFFTTNFRETNPMLYKFLIVPQAWTIGVEIMFYIIAPFLVRRNIKTLLFLILSSFLLRIVLLHFGLRKDPWSYRFFPTELIFFLLGIIGYHVYKKVEKINIKRNHLLVVYVFIVGFTILYSGFSFRGKMYAYLFSFFLCVPFIFILSKNWKIDRYIGDLSYPIYISHILIYTVLTFFDFSFFNKEKGLSLALFTVLFSILLNRLVSDKIEKIRQGRLLKTS